MTPAFQEYEKKIQKKHSFSFTPKFRDEFRTNLKKTVFIPIVVKTFERLGWDLVYQDETTAEAKRKGSWNKWTEKITVSLEAAGKVEVSSVSLGNEMWDIGRNSKRVKLFIYAFEKTAQEFDAEALDELEREIERKNNWDDYVIPETLPQPKKRSEPLIGIPIVGGLVISVILGYTLAFLTFNGVYIIGLFELGVALAIGFAFKYFIRLGNYVNFQKLQFILGATVLLTYILNQYFLYQIILTENNLEPIGFLSFIQFRLEQGLTVKNINTGWVGLVISWIFQLVWTYFIVYLKVVSSITVYRLERVPTEVVDFTVYHLIKGKNEDEVRHELSKKGWRDKESQDEAFHAIAGLQDARELGRME